LESSSKGKGKNKVNIPTLAAQRARVEDGAPAVLNLLMAQAELLAGSMRVASASNPHSAESLRAS
jgi:hypothetical protein